MKLDISEKVLFLESRKNIFYHNASHSSMGRDLDRPRCEMGHGWTATIHSGVSSHQQQTTIMRMQQFKEFTDAVGDALKGVVCAVYLY
jgi:hypothetical protein